jgi:pseudouridine-5'-phosphate glycosidase/pseudouridine kinase
MLTRPRNGSYSVKFPITESPEAQASSGPYQQNLPVDILVAGALAVDCSCDFSPGAASRNKSPLLHTSNPAIIRHSLGGVGHNVAKAAHYLGKNVRLCSIVADDLAGMMARQGLQKDGMDVDDIIVSDSSSESSTAQYVAVNDVGKDLVLAMADMAILESTDTKTLQKWSTTIQRTKPSWVMADANWHPSLLRFWLEEGKKSGASTAYEPVSTAKSSRVFSSTPAAGFPDFAPLPVFPGHLVDLASPNFMELQSMSEAARSCGHFERQEWWETIDALGIPSSGITHRLEALTSNELVVQGIPQQTIQMLPYMPTILTKMGSKGVLLTKLLRKNDAQLSDPKASRYIASRSPDAPNSSVGGLYIRWFPPPAVLESTEIVSVNGAGDTFLGAILSALTRPDCPAVEDVVDFAQAQAARSLKSRETVSPDLKSVGVLKSQDCTYEA